MPPQPMQPAYHSAQTDVTWAASDTRRWLNGEFLDGFSQQERERIAAVTVVNNNSPWDRGVHEPVSGGPDTQDGVFLLSIDEALRYFGDSGLVADGAPMGGAGVRHAQEPESPNHGIYSWGMHDRYSNARIAYDFDGLVSWWWLRSPGHIFGLAAAVSVDGGLFLSGAFVPQSGGVRPALWLLICSNSYKRP